MMVSLILLVVGLILVWIGSAIGEAGAGTEVSTLGCLPGILGLLCILAALVWFPIALFCFLFW